MKLKTAVFAVVSAATLISFAYAFDLPKLPEIPDVGELVEPAGPKPKRTLKPFNSQAELKAYFKQIGERRRNEQQAAKNSSNTAITMDGLSASPTAKDEKGAKEDDSITNNQHAGVDEGGIVKVRGEYLVILRRGRLFTVRIGDNSLTPVSSADAFAPDINPSGDWYDEMLISGNTIAVIGYSYGRGGTEVNLFDLDDACRIAYRSTYHLRSNDYYSSRNYASRLIGNKLIFYTPMYLGYYGDPMEHFPAVRRWRKGATEKDFEPIAEPTRIYRAESVDNSSYNTALHTVTVCDLANRGFDCKATGVLGAPGRVFYVSPQSVYVWTTDWQYGNQRTKASSMLYQLPLDGSAPSALGVAGSPVDQFSFLESSDGHLNVLVRSDGYGEQMWGSEFAAGEVALFRTPLDRFSDGSESAPFHRYRELPKPEGYTFQNRFVGEHVLYGTGSGWDRPREGSSNLYAVNWVNGDVSKLKLDHGVDRIEQVSSDAVIVGANGSDLYFTPIKLDAKPDVRRSFVRKNAAQGELRSHGFFYKPTDKDSGFLGLPIARGGRSGYRHLVDDSAAILFIRNDDLDFSEVGELASRTKSANDNCKASCVDWYGNARPIFIRNRVFALLGYELVEGELSRSGISELRRTNFSPRRTVRSVSE